MKPQETKSTEQVKVCYRYQDKTRLLTMNIEDTVNKETNDCEIV